MLCKLFRVKQDNCQAEGSPSYCWIAISDFQDLLLVNTQIGK